MPSTGTIMSAGHYGWNARSARASDRDLPVTRGRHRLDPEVDTQLDTEVDIVSLQRRRSGVHARHRRRRSPPVPPGRDTLPAGCRHSGAPRRRLRHSGTGSGSHPGRLPARRRGPCAASVAGAGPPARPDQSPEADAAHAPDLRFDASRMHETNDRLEHATWTPVSSKSARGSAATRGKARSDGGPIGSRYGRTWGRPTDRHTGGLHILGVCSRYIGRKAFLRPLVRARRISAGPHGRCGGHGHHRPLGSSWPALHDLPARVVASCRRPPPHPRD